MSDISMCANGSCPLRKTCRRFNTSPNPWMQYYGNYNWNEDNEGNITCPDYWDTKNDSLSLRK